MEKKRKKKESFQQCLCKIPLSTKKKIEWIKPFDIFHCPGLCVTQIKATSKTNVLVLVLKFVYFVCNCLQFLELMCVFCGQVFEKVFNTLVPRVMLINTLPAIA